MIAKNGQIRKVEGEKLEVLYEGNWARCRWVEPTKGLHGSSVVAYHRLLRPIGCCRFELNFLVKSPFFKRISGGCCRSLGGFLGEQVVLIKICV